MLVFLTDLVVLILELVAEAAQIGLFFNRTSYVTVYFKTYYVHSTLEPYSFFSLYFSNSGI